MSNTLFILVIFGVGLLLAIYVDRLRSRRGSNPPDSRERPGNNSERSRWLHFWYTGRFPDDGERDGKDQDRK